MRNTIKFKSVSNTKSSSNLVDLYTSGSFVVHTLIVAMGPFRTHRIVILYYQIRFDGWLLVHDSPSNCCANRPFLNDWYILGVLEELLGTNYLPCYFIFDSAVSLKEQGHSCDCRRWAGKAIATYTYLIFMGKKITMHVHILFLR